MVDEGSTEAGMVDFDGEDESLIFDAEDEYSTDPLSNPGLERIPNHVTEEGNFHPDHCEESGCHFKRGHPGPHSNEVPNNHDDPTQMEGPPSRRLRSNQTKFTQQESFNVRQFLFRSLFMLGTAMTPTDSAPTAQSFVSSTVPNFAYATCFNNTLHVETELGASSIPIPKGLRQALNSEHAAHWIEAVYKEYSKVLSHNVFKVVRRDSLPDGTNIMHCHVVFTVKSLKDGSIERFKARLVAGGDTQMPGMDFDAIFATVAKFSTFRMGLHIAAVRNYNITGVDISTAFLYGDIDVCVYMRMPEGLPRYDGDGNELVCQLLKSLYGLKQAPRIWYQLFSSTLQKFGFVQSVIDPCFFIYEKGNVRIYGILWVDDLILLDNDPSTREAFVQFLRDEKYDLTDRGELDFVLGITLRRDRPNRRIYLNQRTYVNNICEKYGGLLDASLYRNFDVPSLSEIADFSQDDCPLEGSAEWTEMRMYVATYYSLIGVASWLSSATHPEIATTTSILSRFTINPARKHWSALIRLFLYLRKHNGSHELALGGTGANAEDLSIYTDASHEEGPSLSGVLVVVGTCAVHWFCRRQKFTKRNSTAAEAMANADGCDEGIYMRELQKDFHVAVKPTPFLSDNESSVKLHKDFYSCKKSKHILRAIATLRQYVMTKVFMMFHIFGIYNYADMLTKPLPLDVFRRFRDAILGGYIVTPAHK
jgi:hypothetical protein